MQMRATAVPGAAHSADDIPLIDRLTTHHIDRAEVGVQRLPTVPMIQHNDIAVTVIVPAGIDHDPGVGGEYAIPGTLNHGMYVLQVEMGEMNYMKKLALL